MLHGFLCTDGSHPTLSLVSPIWSWTGDPLRRDFADQQTVTWTADVLLSNRSVLYGLQREGQRHKGKKNEETKQQVFSVFRFSSFWGSEIVPDCPVLFSSAEILR